MYMRVRVIEANPRTMVWSMIASTEWEYTSSTIAHGHPLDLPDSYSYSNYYKHLEAYACALGTPMVMISRHKCAHMPSIILNAPSMSLTCSHLAENEQETHSTQNL